MGTWTYNCNFEFIIYDEGDWIVTLKNWNHVIYITNNISLLSKSCLKFNLKKK
jgi:hypothetical protein